MEGTDEVVKPRNNRTARKQEAKRVAQEEKQKADDEKDTKKRVEPKQDILETVKIYREFEAILQRQREEAARKAVQESVAAYKAERQKEALEAEENKKALEAEKVKKASEEAAEAEYEIVPDNDFEMVVIPANYSSSELDNGIIGVAATAVFIDGASM